MKMRIFYVADVELDEADWDDDNEGEDIKTAFESPDNFIAYNSKRARSGLW